MSNTLGFEFTVDKTNNSVFMVKEFAAGLSLVWGAFTQQEILDKWGAPQPWVLHTKYMTFEVGGRRLYSMTNPQGEQHWSIQEFTAITPKTNFKMRTNFSDENGNINTAFDSSENNLDFREANSITTVKTTIKYATAAVLEMIMARGFKQGYTMAMNNLDSLLATLS